MVHVVALYYSYRKKQMGITGKEIAKELNITPAAVSMALNGRPGVSEETRKAVLSCAKENGYDFSRLKKSRSLGDTAFIIYRRQGAVVSDTPFFSELFDGVESGLKEAGYRTRIFYIDRDEAPELVLADIIYSGVSGIILLGTEMQEEDFAIFSDVQVPLVLLDVYFDKAGLDSVVINNNQGAYLATDYLIRKTRVQPGYLHSSYPIANFNERQDGFFRAVRAHGMPTDECIVHRLSPSTDGALSDMRSTLKKGGRLAKAYFADNDLIAIGAIRAFKEAGYDVPGDISVIGFDDIEPASYLTPALTTVHVPKKEMGQVAARRLVDLLNRTSTSPLKIEAGTRLARRKSVQTYC